MRKRKTTLPTHARSFVVAGTALLAVIGSLPAAQAQKNSRRLALSDDLRRQCLRVLRNGLKGGEFWPSIHAAEALTLAGRGAEVRRILEPKLKTETDDRKRCGISRELVRAGDVARASVLLRILGGSKPYGHVHAAESLYKVGRIGDGRWMRKRFSETKNVRLKIMAAAALGKCGNPQALAFLRMTVAHEDVELARIAAWVLARIGDGSDLARLRVRLKRCRDDLSRAYFQNALANLGDENNRKQLLWNLRHKEAPVRTYAAVFAGEAGLTRAAKVLQTLLADDNADVRVRAAQSLLVLSQRKPASSRAFAVDVFRATKAHPRYSEGSIVELADGSLLYAVTEFIGSGSDFARARIVARTSSDGGRTWGKTRVLQKNVGGRNVMSVTLRRLKRPVERNTPIGLFYLVKNSFSDLRVYLRISTDEARTFGKPIRVTATPGYHVMNNDRVTLLSNGRLVVPVATTKDVKAENHFRASCFLSDDGGKTWRPGKGSVDLPRRGAMEPEVVELADNRLMMLLRTQLGFIAASFSKDGGETWSKPESWGVKAPESPATVRRIPATGDLLLVWNNTFAPGAGHGGKRTPLSAAVSTDAGRTWKFLRDLETRKDRTYAYTSLTFVEGRVLMSYYVRDEKTGRISSRFRSLPVKSFYRKHRRGSK
ncbi:MAG: exo-alpha-sialidase [Planctomycetaceae bacterium]